MNFFCVRNHRVVDNFQAQWFLLQQDIIVNFPRDFTWIMMIFPNVKVCESNRMASQDAKNLEIIFRLRERFLECFYAPSSPRKLHFMRRDDFSSNRWKALKDRAIWLTPIVQSLNMREVLPSLMNMETWKAFHTEAIYKLLSTHLRKNNKQTETIDARVSLQTN